jgi:MFS family permease
MAAAGEALKRGGQAAAAAWVLASVFYFYQYVMRSAPGVMVPQLTTAFGVSAAGLSAMVGLFYWGYAPFHLVAGVAVDQLGPRRVLPVAVLLAGSGCLLFASGAANLASLGCFLEGAGAAFAMVGAAFIATTFFPASRVATLIGGSQMFGMAGGSAGQFLVAPAVAAGLGWRSFWIGLGLAGLPLAALLLFLTPRREASKATVSGAQRWKGAVGAVFAVLRNPQSILCGLIAGLMFMPTTIFSLVWGVRYLQEGHDLPYMVAVMRSAAVPAGWMIGSPLLGALSDRIGRRKPVIIGAAAVLLASLGLILFSPAGVFPPFSLGLLAGIASGGAMIPYTVIKEANRPEFRGTSTGVIGFLNFSLSALLGPLFGNLLVNASGGGERELPHYQAAFQPLLYAVGLAIVLALLLRETGSAARRPSPAAAGPALNLTPDRGSHAQ